MRQRSVDEKFMRMAIELARKGAGKTSPNPVVGAVIVKNGRVVASGYHKKAGLMHAEAVALKKAGKKASGATLYSTLEACTHYGKTPPCVDAIIKAGIKRAVFAMRDPNPINYGHGISILKKSGIETGCGLLEEGSSELNRPFIKFMKKGMPYVVIKVAQSLDGKIADSKGRSRWISSKSSRRFVHELRAQSDAVMVGVNTLIRDNPLLTSRRSSKDSKQPLRIVLDTNLRTALNARILQHDSTAEADLLVVGGNGASLEKKALLERKGANVILLPRKKARVDLSSLMKYLAKQNVLSVLCEGGGELIASLLKERLADEILFFISPRIIGGRGSPTSCGGIDSDIRKSFALKDISVSRIGSDVLVRGLL